MDRVTSLVKALDLLTLLGGSPQSLTVQEIAAAMNLPRSTVVRVLNTLIEYGLVEKQGRKLRCSDNFENWCNRDRHQRDRIRYRRILESVAAVTGELVLLGVQDGAGIVHIDYIECDQAIRVAPAPATRHNIRSNAIGKLCLAMRPDLAEPWCRDDPAFSEELQLIRETGVAWNREESVAGMIALAMFGLTRSAAEPKVAVAWPLHRFNEAAGQRAEEAIRMALRINTNES